MPNYRRFYGTGMPIFITAVTHKRQPILIKHISILKSAFNKVKASYPFNLNAYVILPDHLHILMSLPNFDDDFSKRMQLIKTNFTKAFQNNKKTWQNRFWDHIIRNDLDLEEKLDYINNNPVKHGLVSDPVDYKYSSARNYYLNDYSLIKIDNIDL